MTWENPTFLNYFFSTSLHLYIRSKLIYSRTTTEELDNKTTTPVTIKTTKTTTQKTTTTMAEEKITTTPKPDLVEMEPTTVSTPNQSHCI